MNDFTRIERRLPQLLTELAEPRTPDYFELIVQRTAVSTQRPAWTFLERWIPVSVTTFRGAFASNVPWRNLALLGLLILAIVAGIVVVGSRPRALPAPFGPALPGLVAYEAGGDIFTVDPETGETTTLVGGPALDSDPVWSLDGARVAFRRDLERNRSAIYVIGREGGDVTLVTPEPIGVIRDHIFSPDGTRLLITSSVEATSMLTIADVEGRDVRPLDLHGAASSPAFRPPDGREFAFVTGSAFSDEGQGISAYDLGTGDIRVIVAPIPGAEIVGRPTFSPDGTKLAYAAWAPSLDMNSRVFTANADGSDRKALPHPDTCCEAMPSWSNDGTRLAITRWRLDDTRLIAIVPWDEGGVGLEVEVPNVYRGIASWSPDDRWILVAPLLDEAGAIRSEQVLIDAATGALRPIAWESKSDPTVQRLAP